METETFEHQAHTHDSREVAATLHACLEYLRGEAERAELHVLAHLLAIASIEAADFARPQPVH